MSRPHTSIGFATIDDVDELAGLRFALYEEQDGTVAESFEVYRERFAGFAARALASKDWRAWWRDWTTVPWARCGCTRSTECRSRGSAPARSGT